MKIAAINYNPAGINPDTVKRMKELAVDQAGFGRSDWSFSYRCPVSRKLDFLDAWFMDKVNSPDASEDGLAAVFLNLDDLGGTRQSCLHMADRLTALGVSVRIASFGADREWPEVKDAVTNPAGGNDECSADYRAPKAAWRRKLGPEVRKEIVRLRTAFSDERQTERVDGGIPRTTDISSILGVTNSTVTTLLGRLHFEELVHVQGRPITMEESARLEEAMKADFASVMASVETFPDYGN